MEIFYLNYRVAKRGEDQFFNFLALWTNINPFDIESTVLGEYNRLNIFHPGCLNNTFGNSNTSNVFGPRHMRNIWGNGSHSNIFDKSVGGCVFGDIFMFNHSKVEFYEYDFTSATHVYGGYNCEIYFDKTDGIKLRYMDGGTLTIADITD